MNKVFDKTLDERYFFARLDCGLPVFVIPKKGINEKVALLAVKYGSNDNSWRTPDQKEFITMPEGIAHFLEHQQFKKESGDIGMEYARYGSNYNASTGYQNTTYFFTNSSHFNENLDILLKSVFTSHFKPESVEKEKSIIEQELRMYNDMADFKVYDNLMQNLYQKHPIRITIGGTVESVRRITMPMLQQCYNTFYNPANIVAVISGDLEPAQVIQYLNKATAKIHNLKSKIPHPEIIRNIPAEPKDIKNLSTTNKMAISTGYLLIGYKDNQTGLEGLPLIRQNLITNTLLELLFGKSSQLYTKLYEEKLIDDRFGFGYSSYKTFGHTIISAETDKAEALYERIMNEMRRLAKKLPFSSRELEEQKRKLIGKFVWTFNSPRAIASLFAGYYFNNTLTIPGGKEVYEAAKLTRKITMKDIQQRFAEHLDNRYHALSLIKPV